MKLFLALALIAVVAAAPEPVRLPVPATPEVAERDIKIDPVIVVDTVQDAPVEAQVGGLRIVDPVPETVFDAVKIADSPVNAPAVDAVKIAEAPAQEIQVDAVRFEVSPQAEVIQPAQAVPVKIYSPFELARGALNSRNPVVYVHAPLVQKLDIPQEVKVDSPVQEEIVKIADLPAPIKLQAASLPVVKDAQFDAVKFVDSPQYASPLEMQPILPIENSPSKHVPQQIMDIIMMAEQQQQPKWGNVVVDPLLR